MGTKFLRQNLLRLQQSTPSVHRGRKEEILDGFLAGKWLALSRTSHLVHLLEPPVHHSNRRMVITSFCLKGGKIDNERNIGLEFFQLQEKLELFLVRVLMIEPSYLTVVGYF